MICVVALFAQVLLDLKLLILINDRKPSTVLWFPIRQSLFPHKTKRGIRGHHCTAIRINMSGGEQQYVMILRFLSLHKLNT
jgi:hypothetical protein